MKNIYDIILKYSDRGIEKLRDFDENDYYLEAWQTIKSSKKGIVFLYTGFFVGSQAETDGPVGTYFLAKALKRLGFYPVMVTDIYCKNFFKEIKCLYIPIKSNNINYYEDILNLYAPVLHISCERCGRNKEDRYLNHKLEDITDHTADLDHLFELGRKRAKTIAIGDGGNEIGMGNFLDFFESTSPNFASKVTCDTPLIASVSNWGAYGLISLLSKELLPTIDEVESYMEHILSLGAVDGILKTSSKSVDGKSWETEEEIISLLRDN